ncbi:hypothetical protein HID58_062009 [Brassica napus]|uniref:Aminotransferase class I/classII large domain-containing protein n=1 Tax=Brassica napus TaxID=3708 RepID=A0ABQ8A0E7_BRANA|nr:hypothetical protein HID58_062009 [Brassica napus]
MSLKLVDYESLNGDVKKYHYAIRGSLLTRKVLPFLDYPKSKGFFNTTLSKPVLKLANLVDSLLGLWISKHILSGENQVSVRSVPILVWAMVIINSRNPTGQCLSEANLREILRFCYDEILVLFRDEMYQQNIYKDERPSSAPRK